MKSEKLTIIERLLSEALANLSSQPSITRECIRDARGMINALGDKSSLGQLSLSLSAYVRQNYFFWGAFWAGLNAVLDANNFHTTGATVGYSKSKEGNTTLILSSNDETIVTHIHVTWYEMQVTGKHEFVAYVC